MPRWVDGYCLRVKLLVEHCRGTQNIVSLYLTCHRPYPNHSVPIIVDHVDNRSASTNMGDGLGPGTTSDLSSSSFHRTAPRNASGTFLDASSVGTSAHRNTTPHCTIPVTTPHSTSLLHHYYKHTTATATNTHLPHLAMLMMLVMSSTPTCSDLLIHSSSPPLGDCFLTTTRFDLDLYSDVDVDLGLPRRCLLLAACRGKQ